MDIQTEINRITKAKNDIVAAVEQHGISVPDDVQIGSLPAYVAGISGGADLSGSILDGSITHYSNDTIKEIKSYAFRDCNELTTLDLPAVETINSYCCYACDKLSHLNAPLASVIGQYAFYLTNFTTLNLPSVKTLGNRAVTGTNMTTLDLGACTSLNANALYGSKALNVIVLRTPTMCALSDVNALSGTCFASGKTGGTVYVPSALIPSYQSATNWSTLYSGGTCTFAAIEGSEYE